MSFAWIVIVIIFFILEVIEKEKKNASSRTQSKPTSQVQRPPVRPASSVQEPPVRKQVSRSFNSEQEKDRVYEKRGAAYVKYTTKGCGCCSTENEAGLNKSGAAYDENRFFDEAQMIRHGKWT